MFTELTRVTGFITEAFVHIWPYLLITIPLAVAVKLSGAARFIEQAFSARPIKAILLATLVGAFSPFCSCGVIPVVASLLLGGVPLAPVMSFWIASPSMDPEIFFLSVATIGWKLAIWRLGGTLVLSLAAGLITHALVGRGWLGSEVLRSRRGGRRQVLAGLWSAALRLWKSLLPSRPAEPALAWVGATATPDSRVLETEVPLACGSSSCGGGECSEQQQPGSVSSTGEERKGLWRRLAGETASATWMVARFMALAFLLEAILVLYVPAEWVTGLLGAENRFVVPLAALIGVPVYTSNLTALPLVGGLLNQGMSPGAALAFLVAGATTTLPAMAAVWGLVRPRVFSLYIAFVLVGAIALGSALLLVAALGG
jgi:uncharacterized membrane protein YraQ (UPF0718 family)